MIDTKKADSSSQDIFETISMWCMLSYQVVLIQPHVQKSSDKKETSKAR